MIGKSNQKKKRKYDFTENHHFTWRVKSTISVKPKIVDTTTIPAKFRYEHILTI